MSARGIPLFWVYELYAALFVDDKCPQIYDIPCQSNN